MPQQSHRRVSQEISWKLKAAVFVELFSRALLLFFLSELLDVD